MSDSGAQRKTTRRAVRISDLYLDNPFRILKLSTDATLAEISKAGQKLQMLSRFAGSDDRGASAVDEGEIKRAVQELKDPVRRLQHELFWVRLSAQEERFWHLSEELREFPQAVGGIAGERFEAICDEEIDVLQKHHNLAVLFHAQAIAVERLRIQEGLSSDHAGMADELWQKSLRQWSFVLDSEKFWLRIEERIFEYNDPRLSVGQVRELKERMPQLVLEPNVESAKYYLGKVDSENASRHVRFLNSCDIHQGSIEAALGRFYEPLLKQIRECTERHGEQLEELDRRARKKAEQKRGPLLEETFVLRDSLIDEVQPVVRAIKSVGDLPGMGEERAMDEIALLLQSFAQSFHHYFNDAERAIKTLKLALEWASTGSTMDKIRENHDLVREAAQVKKAEAALEANKFEEAIKLGEQLVKMVPAGRKSDARQFLEYLRIRATNTLLTRFEQTSDRNAEISYLSRAQQLCSDPEVSRNIQIALSRLRQQSSGCGILLALSTVAAGIIVGLFVWTVSFD